MHEASQSELRWYYQDSHGECEVPHLAASLRLDEAIEDEISERVYGVGVITRAAGIRRRLQGLEQPHADVLQWAFELRRWHPRILTLFSWPSVAMHTMPAQWALAVDGVETRDVWGMGRGRACVGETVPGGDWHMWRRPPIQHDAPEGMAAMVVELRPQGDVVAMIRAETARRVNEALKAYEGAA